MSPTSLHQNQLSFLRTVSGGDEYEYCSDYDSDYEDDCSDRDTRNTDHENKAIFKDASNLSRYSINKAASNESDTGVLGHISSTSSSATQATSGSASISKMKASKSKSKSSKSKSKSKSSKSKSSNYSKSKFTQESAPAPTATYYSQARSKVSSKPTVNANVMKSASTSNISTTTSNRFRAKARSSAALHNDADDTSAAQATLASDMSLSDRQKERLRLKNLQNGHKIDFICSATALARDLSASSVTSASEIIEEVLPEEGDAAADEFENNNLR